MPATRRHFCTTLAASLMLTSIGRAQGMPALTVTDMAGRTIRLPGPPRRIILLEAHDLLTMSLLHPDPASLVVGWAATDRIDSDAFRARLQGNRPIEVLGRLTPDTLSLEAMLALKPDLVVTTAFMTPPGDTDSLALRLEHYGVPVVFSDVASNTMEDRHSIDPITQLKISMRLWGDLLGAPEKAQAYVDFVERTLADIAVRLSGAPAVTTYLEVQSTVEDCCWAAGRKIWGELLTLSGGQLLDGVKAPWFEKLSLETVIASPHEAYIASGGGWSVGGRPLMGPGVDPAAAHQSLRHLIEGRPNFDQLESVRKGHVHAIWTGLITNLPLNILFVAQVARWLHPERTINLNPDTILQTINSSFAAVPIDGPLWISL